MKTSLRIVACLTIIFGLWACERPESPNFQVNHAIEAPLTVNQTYEFLGGSEALIDSTSEDFADLFSTNSNGLVQLSKEQEFDFGDLNDAIPEVNVPATTVNPQVGEIGLTNFNSGSGNVGSAGFQSVTGFSSPSQGQQIPGGATPGTVNIDFSTDYFQSATIKEDGDLQLSLTNNLGFNIDELEITLNSGSTTVGSTTIGTDGDPNDNFDHNTTETSTITIPASTQLSDLNVDISANWDTQNMQEEGDNLVVNDVTGQNLMASQVSAAIESQSFNTNGSSSVNNNNFEFRESDDRIVLSNSTQNVNELTLDIDNQIGIGIQSLNITFPEIEDSQGNAFTINMTDISANESQSKTYDISQHSITSETVTYSVSAQTENTQQNDNVVTIAEDDELVANVSLQGLDIGRANGYIVPKEVLLNTDVTNDGRENLDVFNDQEAEITNVDGISEISDRISDITFENPTFLTKYLTNLGVNTTIYAAIVGTDSKGNTIYLTGKDGSKYDVSANEIPLGLEANGVQLTEDQVIKFTIEQAGNPSPNQGEEGQNEFNSSNTNASEFFSNLPTAIRFAGIAHVNDDQSSGEIVNPVIFDPTLNFDLPFNFSANNASFKDTMDADLGDLPGSDSDQQLSEATFTINYENGLPLDLDLSVYMLDENGNEVTHKAGIEISAASTNNDGFVEEGSVNENKMEITFTEEELQNLNQTRSLVLDVGLNTPQQNAVKIRASDTIKFYMDMKVQITSTVN